MNLEMPQNKIENVNEFSIPSEEITFDENYIQDLGKRLHCRFDGGEFKKIFESLENKTISLPENHYTVYDKLDLFPGKSVMDVLFEQGVEEMEVMDNEKIIRNIKYFVENNTDNKILLNNNWYSHLGFYKNEKNIPCDILCQRHNDSNEWLFWITESSARTNNTHRAIVETINK